VNAHHAVETARGPVPVTELGRVLMHEHIAILNPEIQLNYPGKVKPWDEDEKVREAIEVLDEVKAAGIDSLVDVTVVPMGRNTERIRRISEATRLNIIVATGLYVLDRLPPTFAHLEWHRGHDPLVALFVADIEEGCGGGSVRASIIKCATDAVGMTEDCERVFRACAKAHLLTGAPITTHSDAAIQGGLDQQRVLLSEGVDLGNAIIGHCGDTTDLDYLERLLDGGSCLGMDRFGLDTMCPFADRVETVAELCSRGYADRLVLSHDKAFHNDWASDRLLAKLPNRSFLHLTSDVVPALRERGVSDSQVDQMLIENPRRLFGIAGARRANPRSGERVA
jgi:phosphotriesterase-related protein